MSELKQIRAVALPLFYRKSQRPAMDSLQGLQIPILSFLSSCYCMRSSIQIIDNVSCTCSRQEAAKRPHVITPLQESFQTEMVRSEWTWEKWKARAPPVLPALSRSQLEDKILHKMRPHTGLQGINVRSWSRYALKARSLALEARTLGF